MEDDRQPTFGELIRHARRSAGLTHEALAERAGLSVRGISDLERGVASVPRRDTLDLLADALDLSAEERRRWEAARRRFSMRHSAKESRTAQPDSRTNLPVPLMTMIGRERALGDVVSLLQRTTCRVLTITGTGGIGKTRLALATGHALLADYADGVWFVDLTPLRDAELIPATIAAAMGVTPTGDQPVAAALAIALRSRHLLLVLDNVEQVVDGAPAIGDLLGACPHLTVLATSRVPLRLPGEQEYPLDPLGLPLDDQDAEVERLLDVPAVSLFVTRARAVRPDFALTPANSRPIIDICRHLEGVPLALELAAARTRILSPAAIAQRLDRRLTLLCSDLQGVPTRHRTLRDAIAWSHNLLAPGDQRLFRVLSVFQGGWTLEAVEAIASSLPDDRQQFDVLAGLERLTEHSLVRMREQLDGTSRYTMLDTIREFASEELAASGNAEVVLRSFADYFLNRFESAVGRYTGVEGARLMADCEAERDNVRAVLGWAIAHDAELAIRLSVALYPFWWRRGLYGEARRWLELALSGGLPISAATRAYGLQHFGLHAATQGDYGVAQKRLEEARNLFAELGDRRGLAGCLFGLGRIAMFSGDNERALKLYDEGIPISREAGGAFLNGLLGNAGDAAIGVGDYDRAVRYLEEGLEFGKEHEQFPTVAVILASRGMIALKTGDLKQARSFSTASLMIHKEHRPERRFAVQALEERAWVEAAERHPERVAVLLGVASRERERMGVPVPASVQIEYDRYVPVAQALIDTATWEQAWQHGRELSLGEAIDFALADDR